MIWMLGCKHISIWFALGQKSGGNERETRCKEAGGERQNQSRENTGVGLEMLTEVDINVNFGLES